MGQLLCCDVFTFHKMNIFFKNLPIRYATLSGTKSKFTLKSCVHMKPPSSLFSSLSVRNRAQIVAAKVMFSNIFTPA